MSDDDDGSCYCVIEELIITSAEDIKLFRILQMQRATLENLGFGMTLDVNQYQISRELLL